MEQPFSDNRTQRRHGRITPAMLVDAFDGAMRRFPVTMIYVIYLALWSMVEIATEISEPKNLVMALWYLGGVGIPLTLAVKLWCEYLDHDWRKPMVIANILLAADFVYILCCGSSLGSAWTIGRGALVTALGVGIVFIPSRKPMAWNFADNQIAGLVIAACFSFCFGIATMLIYGTIGALFGVWSVKLFACMDVVGCGVIPTVIFLNRILTPADCEARAATDGLTKFQCGTAKFFVLPIVAVYMAVLYVYGFRILFTWTLPRGVVSLSVTGLSAAVLVLMFMLEGVRRTLSDDRPARVASRIAPWLMLPLLVLMSVAVGYRIGEYGMTASRLYVLTFNVWCYCVFIYLGVSRTRRLNGVALSFAIVFLATSILPWANYVNVSNQLMRHSLRSALVKAGLKEFPVSQEEFNKVFENLPKSQRKNIRSKIEYLDTRDDHSLLDGITDFGYYSDDGLNQDLEPYEVETVVIEETIDTSRIRLNLDATKRTAVIPDGFRGVKRGSLNTYETMEMTDGCCDITVDKVRYRLPVDSLASLDADSLFEAVTLRPVSGNADTVFVANDMNITILQSSDERQVDYLNVSGFVLTR